MSMASLMVFYGLLVGTMDPARKLTDSFNRLQKAAAAGERIYAYLDREPTIRDPQHPVAAPRLAKNLTISGIRFGYNPEQMILHNLHLTIQAGETIAIVGPNGCGKSTLLNLIPRFYDPQSGSIEIDGVDIRKMRRRDLRQQISVVTQDAMLFDDTVFNNIRYSAPNATKEQVIAAAKQAHAHRFIEEQLSHGYDTVIGPLGGRLSGGQRQRIALARAMLRNPALLLLDEATSQIDPESEHEIHTALEEFVRGRTSIMVTHGYLPWTWPIGSWSWTAGRSSIKEPTPNCCRVAKCTADSIKHRCVKQHKSRCRIARRRKGGECITFST